MTAIDKGLPADDVDGENIGIAKFGPDGAATLIEIAHEIMAGRGEREWLPRAFATFIARRPLHVVESRGYPWIEIDFPEDYWRACSEVLPAIDGASAPPARTAAAQLGRTLRHV